MNQYLADMRCSSCGRPFRTFPGKDPICLGCTRAELAAQHVAREDARVRPRRGGGGSASKRRRQEALDQLTLDDVPPPSAPFDDDGSWETWFDSLPPTPWKREVA